MKTILKSLLLIFLLAFALQSCEDQDDVEAPANLQVNDFIWHGLNEVYLWQADVPNLADDRFQGDQLNSYLSGYPDPEELFQELLNRPISKYPASAVDRFSWIVKDYTVLEQQLNGITKNNGLDFQLTRVAEGSNDLVGFVRYVIPNSDASKKDKDIKRGDFFTSVNGTKLTVSNYRSLLYTPDSYTLDLATITSSGFVLTGKSVSLTKTVLEENPILVNKVIETGGHKIGYLMYNGFYADYDVKLNEAFGDMKGVTDLVLDLRYNGGGSVRSATRLASMITGQFPGEVFSKMQFNLKIMAAIGSKQENITEKFVTKIEKSPNDIDLNSLRLGKVYILTTENTASASELIINGLKPYITVIQIGETTTGKNAGSQTIYDSETLFDKTKINPNHKYAMQPLMFKTANKDNFGDYADGLTPTYPKFDYVDEYGVLGDKNEPFLSYAISIITGIPESAKKVKDKEGLILPYVNDSKKINGLRNEMYLQSAQ